MYIPKVLLLPCMELLLCDWQRPYLKVCEKKKIKHTLIQLNDPNLRCSLTFVLVRRKGQSSLVVIAGGKGEGAGA